MQTLIKSFLLVFVVVTSAAGALFGVQIALAVAVGFATMSANVWLTRKTVRQFTSGGRSALVGLYLFKMTILFGLLFLFLRVLDFFFFNVLEPPKDIFFGWDNCSGNNGKGWGFVLLLFGLLGALCCNQSNSDSCRFSSLAKRLLSW